MKAFSETLMTLAMWKLRLLRFLKSLFSDKTENSWELYYCKGKTGVEQQEEGDKVETGI